MKDYKVDKASLSETFCQEVYQVVCEIPLGKVSTYGSIAALLGMPQCSRMVGRALKQVPDNVSTPCHRVVNASGRLVPGWEEQKQILLEEGVSFKQNGCVGGDGRRGIDVVVEAVFDGRADAELDARVERFEGLGQQVRRGVPEGVLALFVVPFVEFDRSVLFDRARHVHRRAVYRGRERVSS